MLLPHRAPTWMATPALTATPLLLASAFDAICMSPRLYTSSLPAPVATPVAVAVASPLVSDQEKPPAPPADVPLNTLETVLLMYSATEATHRVALLIKVSSSLCVVLGSGGHAAGAGGRCVGRLGDDHTRSQSCLQTRRWTLTLTPVAVARAPAALLMVSLLTATSSPSPRFSAWLSAVAAPWVSVMDPPSVTPTLVPGEIGGDGYRARISQCIGIDEPVIGE